MSAAASISKLHSPLKELVSSVADAQHGKSEKDKAEVSEWIEKVAAGEAVRPDGLKVSVVCSQRLVVADKRENRTWMPC